MPGLNGLLRISLSKIRVPFLYYRHLLISLFLCFGCNYPVLELPIEQSAHPFSGKWEYRYGDSPTLSDGSAAWSSPENSDEGWRESSELINPPGRKSHEVLWLRTRLSSNRSRDLVIYFPSIKYYYDAYVNGRAAGSYPFQSKPSINQYNGTQAAFVRIPSGEHLCVITLKITSRRLPIGLSEQPLIGDFSDIAIRAIKACLSKAIVGLSILVVGLIGVIIFAIRRREYSYLYFSLLCWSVGIYMTFSLGLANYILYPYPGWWWEIEIVSFYLVGITTLLFYQSIFGTGPLRATRYIFYGYILLGITLVISIALFSVPMPRALSYVQAGFLLVCVYMTSYSIAIAITGNIDARILGLGFLFVMPFVMYQILVSMIVLRHGSASVHYAAFVMVMTNVVVMARRFRVINERVRNYASILQLTMADADNSDEVVRAQIALRQINQALPISNSSLYLLTSDNRSITLIASEGLPIDPNVFDHRKELAQLAITKKKTIGGVIPAIQSNRPINTTASPSVKRALATVLISQDRLLGALYIELKSGSESLSSDDQDLLNGLSQQLAISILAARAARIAADSDFVKGKMKKQQELLLAAARLAKGDLSTPIGTHDPDNFGQLASALESMRRDLNQKIQTLEDNNREIRELNDELRRQIDQRSRRLLDVVLSGNEHPPHPHSYIVPNGMLGNYYRIIRLIGQGVMGSVYEVERITDRRHLAAKILTAQADRSAMVRFVREAQLLARLAHPNLVSIMDVDVNELGTLYLVMELIQGRTLKNCRSDYREIRHSLPILQQIAEGLAAVHEAGIVHRDLKPANVLIEESVEGKSPQVKLVDFGFSTLAKGVPLSTSESKATQRALASPFVTGEISIISAKKSQSAVIAIRDAEPHQSIPQLVGTPMYMAPECRDRIKGASPPADIFSFGILAYELLTGELPFSTPLIMEADPSLVYFRPFRVGCPGLPEDVADLLERTLNLSPMLRPTALELAKMLRSRP